MVFEAGASVAPFVLEAGNLCKNFTSPRRRAICTYLLRGSPVSFKKTVSEEIPLKEVFTMHRNMGGTDRAVRVAAGMGIISLALRGRKRRRKSRWAYLGSVPLLSGLLGWCPVYELLHVSTRKRRSSGFGALREAVRGRLR